MKNGTPTQATSALNREQRRYLEQNREHAAEELLTKRDTAAFYKCSLRQIELLTAAGKIPKPLYLGASSPRWRRSELIAHLDAQQKATESSGCSMSLPYLPDHIIDEARDLRRRGYSLKSLANHLGIDPEDLRTLLGECDSARREIPPGPKSTHIDDEKKR